MLYSSHEIEAHCTISIAQRKAAKAVQERRGCRSGCGGMHLWLAARRRSVLLSQEDCEELSEAFEKRAHFCVGLYFALGSYRFFENGELPFFFSIHSEKKLCRIRAF